MPVVSEKRILFFVPEWEAASSSVAHSRILSMAQQVQSPKCQCLYIGCESSIDNAEKAGDIIKSIYGITAKIEPLLIFKPGFIGLFKSAFTLYKKTQADIIHYNPTHIYTQSIISCIFSRLLSTKTNAITIFDVQGILAAEVAMRRGKTFYYWLINWLEKREILLAQRIACVSFAMKNYIHELLGRNDAFVIPSCFDENKIYFDQNSRLTIRSHYGWSSANKVIIYSGGLSSWQRIIEIIYLFENIYQQDNSYRFLFMTPEATELQALLDYSSLHKDSYIVGSCLQTEIYHYLSAADISIIMRSNTLVNNVSSPMKIAEYMGCGLPLILTKGIGDYTEQIQHNQLGIVLDESSDMAKQIIYFFNHIWNFSIENRLKVVEFSKNNFSIHAYTNVYEQLFS